MLIFLSVAKLDIRYSTLAVLYAKGNGKLAWLEAHRDFEGGRDDMRPR